MRLLALLAATPPPPQSSQPYTVARALADLDGASWSLVLEDSAGVRVWRDAASTSGAVVLKAEKMAMTKLTAAPRHASSLEILTT